MAFQFCYFLFRFTFVTLMACNLVVCSCKALESAWLEVVKFATAVQSAAVVATKCSNASVTSCCASGAELIALALN